MNSINLIGGGLSFIVALLYIVAVFKIQNMVTGKKASTGVIMLHIFVKLFIAGVFVFAGLALWDAANLITLKW